MLESKGNRLLISTKSKKTDDIFVGDIVLHSTMQTEFEGSPSAEVFFKKRGYRSPRPEYEGVLNLSCVDADSGEPLPCRFTIVDQSTGALVLLGAESNDQQAVRAGVIYSLQGKARTKLSRGHLNHGRDLHGNLIPLGAETFDDKKGVFLDGRKLEANAMELINSGAHLSDPMQIIHDWFALVRSGHRLAGIGSSDSHTVNFAIPGQARTYVECADDAPGEIDEKAAVRSFVMGISPLLWVK
ncbi:MAG: hypothetical protein L3J39_09570 [Verrucomicrobiales bacterium]|nr:hypothetical protein [Verrucomicrobiales bacterium]